MDMKNTQEFTELVAKVRGSFEGVWFWWKDLSTR
jgi:hypothetical protein